MRFWSGEPPADSPNLPKTIPQRWDTADEEWYDGLDGMPYAGLYNLDMLLQADPWQPVWIVEGEKCADALGERGEVATCAAGGAGGWPRIGADIDALRGRHCVVLKDADEAGEQYATDIMSTLPGIAASVRVLALDGAHDVADRLKDGHATDELRRLAAQTESITARMPQILNSMPATQDEQGCESPKTCLRCTALQEQLKIAETSLEHLRRAQARADRIMAIPNEKLPAPAKLVTLAAVRELGQTKARTDKGMMQTYRAAIARRVGVKEQAAGTQLRRAAETGIIQRQVVKTFDDSAIFIAEGPLFDAPEDAPTPERAHTWGGKRVKHCTSCGSVNLETRIVCRDCGTILHRHDTNEPVQGNMQDTPPPEIVTLLASDAQDAPNATESKDCQYCGSDLLNDFGVDGTRCRMCGHRQPEPAAVPGAVLDFSLGRVMLVVDADAWETPSADAEPHEDTCEACGGHVTDYGDEIGVHGRRRGRVCDECGLQQSDISRLEVS